VCLDYDGKPKGCDDLYERFNGLYTLLSTGPADDHSTCGFSGSVPWVCPGFIAASPDATRVFFQTRSTLTPDDTDGGLNDVYVSRVVRGR
jgi:hypothetical protein